MNLKQRTFFFVALSVTGLVLIYGVFSNYYVRQREKQVFDERLSTTQTLAQEFDEFFARGVAQLDQISQLPALRYGLHALEAERDGKQIPVWTTLHYMTFQKDVFTDGVYLLNKQGQVLWSEPPDIATLEASYEPYGEVLQALEHAGADVAFTTWQNTDILIASRVNDDNGDCVGLLVGAIPADHEMIHRILGRKPARNAIAQLMEAHGRVVASTDENRQSRVLSYWRPAGDAAIRREAAESGEAIVASVPLSLTPWTVSIDQDAKEAMSAISGLKLLLGGFGFVIAAITICGLGFMLRSFARPVEMLTRAAKQIADGDLSVRFKLDRTDEIGALATTLDDMKTKVKSSYDLLLASEKMALMGQLVAGIAHELNNPLTVVLGNTQLILMREHDEAKIKNLKKVEESAERASKIVKNLLTFARQEKPERKQTDINSIVTKTLDLHGYEMKVRNIAVSLDLQPGLPYTMADPHQLQQVFLNLMVNAEQAMIDSHGKGALRIKTGAEDGRITITFKDDGPGIKPENVKRIFEPFFTTKVVGKGTGLGLSICQGIIEEHGGSIGVDSAFGVGTTFVIELPIQKWVPAETRPPAPLPKPFVAKKRVLVVDDEAQIRQLFRDVLNCEGHEVDVADNGASALPMVDRGTYDLILSDIKMPDLSGIDFYAALKRRGEGVEQRVVFITGDLMNPETLQFLESTGCRWLGKPFDIEAIKKAVAESPQVAELVPAS